MAVDKVTLEILSNYFRAIVEDVARVVERTSFTTFVKETADFTWHRGLVSAITGAVALPPVLAAAIMLTALTFPDGVIQLFVWGAWAAVVIGLVAAVVGWGARRLFQRHPLPVHRITRAVRRPRGARRAPGETGDPAH